MIYGIFDETTFINDKKRETYSLNVNLEGYFVNNCDIFLTDEMIAECCGNQQLLENAVLLEGAKLDFLLKNFLKEGEDYKNIKKDIKEILAASEMSEEDFIKKGLGRKTLHICKRILQVTEDLAVVTGPLTNIAMTNAQVKTVKAISPVLAASGATSTIIISAIIGTVIGFIINRVIRFLVDTAEFSNVKKDTKKIITDLRSYASKTDDAKLAKKYREQADRLEEALKKYDD